MTVTSPPAWLKRDPGYVIVIGRDFTDANHTELVRALTYCLHLPRSTADVLKLPYRAILECLRFELAHRINIITYPDILTDRARASIDAISPALFITSERMFEEVDGVANAVGAPLGCVSIDRLTQASLADHWERMADHAEAAYKGRIPALRSTPPVLEEISSLTPLKLAIAFLVRRLQIDENMVSPDGEMTENLLDRYFNLHHTLRAFAAVEQDRSEGDISASMARHMASPVRVPQTPLVLGSHSVLDAPPRLQLESYPKEPWNSEALYLVMLTHRTLASHAIGLSIPEIPHQLTQRLRQLENLCAQPTRDIARIWWVLERLGKEAADALGPYASILAPHQLSVVLFTDFPFGLSFLDNASAPLQFLSPVMHRPVLPMAPALQNELSLFPIVYLNGGFRVLVVECLDQADPDYTAGQTAWLRLGESMAGLAGLSFDLQTARSVSELKSLLLQFTPDFVIISGHGAKDKDGQVTGIRIGQELWVGELAGHIPKMVILSACAVTPRSSKMMNIADNLLFQGVAAVVGTLVPIEFGRNAAFLMRFFQYIYQSIIGEEPFRSLDQAWRAALCAGAINDIVFNSPKLLAWATVEWDRMMDDYIPLLQMNKIRAAHIYSDVERFLREYAQKRHVYERFQAELQAKCYFPETMFYLLIGHAHRIVLRDEFSESARRKSSDFDLLGNRKR